MLDWLGKLFCSDIISENEKLKISLNNSNSNLNSLQNQLKILQSPKNPLEAYYNTKYPQVNLTYLRHETDGDYNIDLRNFYMLNDAGIPCISGKDDDEKALNALKYVIKNVTYVEDKTDYGFDEYWAFPFQTLKRKKGDCEDGAILLANIMVKSGIPYWKLRLSAGNVWDGKGTKDLNMSTASNNVWDLKDFKKEIENGITPEQLKQGLELAKEKVQKLNLKKAIFLSIKEKESADNLFVNMLGKQLKIEKEFVKIVEQLKTSEYITKIKTDKTIIQKILKYYVILVTLDITEKKEIMDNLLKEINLGIKSTEGTAGHCYVTYYCESKDYWVVLDWCYWPNQLAISDRKNYKDETNYLNVWFSWNRDYCFSQGTNLIANEYLK